MRQALECSKQKAVHGSPEITSSILANAGKIDYVESSRVFLQKPAMDEAASRSSTTEAKDEQRNQKQYASHARAARTSEKGEPHSKSRNEEAKAAEKGAAQSQLHTAP